MIVRFATVDDAPRVAELHVTRMSEGFLSELGPKFLRILYRRVVRSPDAFVLVADDPERPEAGVVGFAAAAVDLGALYRRFVVHDGVIAALAAAPRLLPAWRKALETLRYPAGGDEGDGGDAGPAPDAEILSVAVDARAAGKGIGRTLVRDTLAELTVRGVPAAKVVTASDNAAALALYEGSGFERWSRISVHEGTSSEVLVWRSS